jgi:hypothetical protein
MKIQVRHLLSYWKVLLLVLVPVCLLPIAIFDGSVTFRCQGHDTFFYVSHNMVK